MVNRILIALALLIPALLIFSVTRWDIFQVQRGLDRRPPPQQTPTI